MERDAVAARRFHRTRNLVTLGIAEHEGGKGLLQRIARAVLLFESSNRNSVQFHFLSQSSLEDSNGVQLGQRLGPAHLKNRRWVRRLCGHRQSKSDNIVNGDVADFRVACAVNASAAVGGVAAERRAQPHFHEIRRSEDGDAHFGGQKTLLAIALGRFQRRVHTNVPRIRRIDKVAHASALCTLN